MAGAMLRRDRVKSMKDTWLLWDRWGTLRGVEKRKKAGWFAARIDARDREGRERVFATEREANAWVGGKGR